MIYLAEQLTVEQGFKILDDIPKEKIWSNAYKKHREIWVLSRFLALEHPKADILTVCDEPADLVAIHHEEAALIQITESKDNKKRGDGYPMTIVGLRDFTPNLKRLIQKKENKYQSRSNTLSNIFLLIYFNHSMFMEEEINKEKLQIFSQKTNFKGIAYYNEGEVVYLKECKLFN